MQCLQQNVVSNVYQRITEAVHTIVTMGAIALPEAWVLRLLNQISKQKSKRLYMYQHYEQINIKEISS